MTSADQQRTDTDTETSIATAVAAEVARLLTTAISAYMRDDDGAWVYPLSEAAERLHMSEQRLTLECRGHVPGVKVAHTQIGKFRGMTGEQIKRYAAQHAVNDDAAPAAPTSDLAAAIAMTQRSGAARPGRPGQRPAA